MINQNIFITCKESRIENNRSFYGCFNLGPFDSGQSLTVANALRRTLLSDSTGIGIVSVSIDNVSHEYSTIPGMRESVLDLILNLKEIVLKKQNNYAFFSKKEKDSSISNQISASYFKPVSGFLKVKGPGVIRAKDLKLPPFLNCVDPEQYIATLSEDGFLCVKFIIMEGKGYMLQTQNNNSFISSKSKKQNEMLFLERKNYVKKRLHFLKEIQKNVKPSKDTSLLLRSSLSLQESKERFPLGSSPTQDKDRVTKIGMKLHNEKTSTIDSKLTTFDTYGTLSGYKDKEKDKNKEKENNKNIYLNLDTVFNPITKVSYIIEDFDNKIVDELNQKVTFINEISALIENSVFLKKELPFLNKDIDLWRLDPSVRTVPKVRTEKNTGDTNSLTLNESEIYKFVESCSIAEIKQLSNYLHPLKRKIAQHNIIIEIWTNGSVHPREALYEAFEKLSSTFLNMQKTQHYNPIYMNESSLLLVESFTQTLETNTSSIKAN